MYNTKTAIVTESDSNYMPAGINENVVIKEVNVKKSPTDKDFLEIIFENEAGKTATMTEWKNEKNQWIVTDEDLQKRDNIQFGRILQVIEAHCPNGIEDKEFNTFLEMITWVKETLDKAEKVKLRLKVSYDNKGYTKVSTYGRFVENMNIKKEESSIKKFARDLFERPIIADKEKSSDPLTNPSTSTPETSTDDDLPF